MPLHDDDDVTLPVVVYGETLPCRVVRLSRYNFVIEVQGIGSVTMRWTGEPWNVHMRDRIRCVDSAALMDLENSRFKRRA